MFHNLKMMYLNLSICVMISLLLFFAMLTESTLQSNLVRMESSVNIFSSSKWTKLQSHELKDDHVIHAIFVLQYDSAEIEALEKIFHDVSDPASGNYGKWLEPHKLLEVVSPKKSHAKVVMDYLSEAGVAREHMVFSNVGDKVLVSMPVKIANKALNTEFALFRSTLKNDVVLARIIKPYHLPTHIAEVVSFVDDIMRFPSLDKIHLGKPNIESSNLRTETTSPFNSCGSGCAGYTTPAVLSKRYGFTVPMKSAAGSNSMAVAEFQLQYYNTADLNQFSQSCDVPAITVQTTYGGNSAGLCSIFPSFCTEALLDIEYIKAVASAVPLTVFYSNNYSILNWINQVLSLNKPPLVHSVSYGNDEVQQTSAQYMYSCNVQFMAAGTRGLSILFAAGDQGVWGRTGVGAVFNPDFPASSPYVTAVGGTNFKTKSVIGPETAWNCGGGGFSNTFARASWQSKAVANYLKVASLPPSSYYNASGRGYPDVSALGGLTNPYCIANGGLIGVAGTSASAPVVAGIIAQLNDIRLQKGKSSLGFLNPLLYANPECFNDVNDGSNNACDGSYGFKTVNGWDPATGLGTPNFACFKTIVA